MTIFYWIAGSLLAVVLLTWLFKYSGISKKEIIEAIIDALFD